MLREPLGKLNDANAAAFSRRNFLVATIDGIIELIKAFSVIPIPAPLT